MTVDPAAPPKTAPTFQVPTDDRDLLAAKAGRVRFLAVPERRYLMIDGSGAPGDQQFRDAFAALYPVAYTLHFALKRRGATARVGALEGLYWFGEPGPLAADAFASAQRDPSAWRWRLLLPVPAEATDDEVRLAFEEVRSKKSPPALELLRCEAWEEGRLAQVLHVGPYAAEPTTVALLHEAIASAGLRPRGCHHEIYISDPSRTAPERLRTVIRQPVERTAG